MAYNLGNSLCARHTAEPVPDLDLSLIGPLMSLAKELSEKYHLSGKAEDRTEAIQALQDALDDTPDGEYALRPRCLLFLSYLYYDTHIESGQMVDLDKAIELAEQTVEELEEGHSDLILARRTLRARLSDKFALTGKDDDLQRAIEATRLSMRLPSEEHWDRPIQFGDMSSLLGSKYLSTGALEDLEEALAMGWKAVECLDNATPLFREGFIHHVADLLRQRAIRTGSLEDLERGIQLAREATDRNHTDQGNLAVALNSLGSLLTSRYGITGVLEDLDEAITRTRECLNLPIHNSTILANILGNLAAQLQKRYLRSKNRSDLEESSRVSRRALEVMPNDHPDRARHQHELGVNLSRVFAVTNDIGDFQDAVESLRLAIEIVPGNHPNRAIYLHSLANMLLQKVSISPSIDNTTEIDELVSATREAIDATPETHPDRGELSYTLGVGLLVGRVAGNIKAGIEEAIPCFEAAIYQDNAPTLCRIQACMALLPISPDPKRCLPAAQLIMDLIPTVIPRQQDHSDRQSSLAELAGLAPDVVAVAIHARRPEVALELLEKGQGLLGASAEQMQVDIIDLHKAHPQHATEFERLRNEINQPTNADASLKQSQALRKGQTLRRYDAVKEFDQLVGRIRHLPDLEAFLQAPTIDAMMSIADRGPIIIVNNSLISCDALVVSPNTIQVIPLPSLSALDVQQRASRGDRGSPDVLEWLWDTIVSPVFDVVGFTETPTSDDDWPHVWWVGTGLLRQFPLHMAGYHRERKKRTALDRVVSSYASSVKALIQSRRRRMSGEQANKAVLVAMQDTPSLSRLSFAEGEIEVVESLCQSMGFKTVQPNKIKPEVLSQLRGCKVFHFAGHGCTDPDDPLKSYLCLQDVQSNPLRVSDLLNLNLKEQPPFLAYLSACGTGRIQEERFMDESVHLISACQLAGFRHVIGTLWEVNDQTCVEMAKVVYEVIKTGQVSDRSVAWGFHEASRRLRDKWVSGLIQDGRTPRTSYRPGRENASLRRHVENAYRRNRILGCGRFKRVGGISTSGTNWGRVRSKPSITRRKQEFLRRREGELLLARRSKTTPAPAWVPFVHYGV